MNFSNLHIQTESLPKVEDLILKPISKSYLKIIAINKLALYIGLFGVAYGVKYALEKKEAIEVNLWYILPILLGFCALNFIASLLEFKKRKYAIREQDVVYAKGLLVHSITTVPISRIQHVEESRSWLARRFGLSTLKIFTAGDAGSDLSMNGLHHLEAKSINDFISSKVNGNN